MNRLGWVGWILIAVALPSVVVAEIGSPDNVPAATLLIPYFEVDIDAGPSQRTTLIGVQNSGPAPVLTQITLWTDLGVPTLTFNLPLTGYDVERFDLYDVFASGQIPNPNVSFPGCDAFLPYPDLALSGPLLAHLVASHRGEMSPVTGACSAVGRGDKILRGYVTVDTVNACSLLLPTEDGYFALGGSGIASNENVLVGDWMQLALADSAMVSELAVAIEASADDPLTDGAGDYTFYANLPSVAGQGLDNRERLPSHWVLPYVARTASLHVWRDAGTSVAPFACGMLPSPFPLDYDANAAFDTQGNATGLTALAFPFAVTSLALRDSLPTVAKQGWTYLDLNTDSGGAAIADARQAWVTVLAVTGGRWASGFPAVALADSPLAAAPPAPTVAAPGTATRREQ